MPERSAKANTVRSKIGAQVRHVFAHQTSKMDRFIRTIGLKRAATKITVANLAYNMLRPLFLERREARG